MKKIKILRGQRWFIWTIVFAIAFLGGLAVYIYNISILDSTTVSGVITNPRLKTTPIVQSKFINTLWSPQDDQDAVLSFKRTRVNDPRHADYDYQFASDSQVREVGYWQVTNGYIKLTPTH